MLNAWTDYPIFELGDLPFEEAPVRPCVVLSYDGNKYCQIDVEGVITEVKAGYLYQKAGRLMEVPNVRYRDLLKLNPRYRRPRGKPASSTITYSVQGTRFTSDGQSERRSVTVKTMRRAIRLARHWGPGTEVYRELKITNREGVTKGETTLFGFIEYHHAPRKIWKPMP